MTPITPTTRPLRPARKLDREDSRRHHRSLLLQLLFRGGPASRADLARSTGLTRVTVSDLIAELLEDGMVVELGAPVESRVGKPPVLVGFAPDAARIVCLDLSVDGQVSGAIVNAAGEVQQRRSWELAGAAGERAVEVVRRSAAELVAAADRKVLGVALGSPGVVDPLGTVIEAPNLGWEELPLATRLAEELGVPAYVANDANAAALGEHTFGAAGTGGLMVLRVGTGVGAGLILEGQLLHGHRSAAGEVGHVVVNPRGEQCACGRTGCLETVLGVPHLRRLVDGRSEREAARLLAAAGRRLGAALAPVVGALNLHELVLSGPVDLLGGPLLDAAASTIRRSTMPVTGDELVVRASSLGDDVVLVGASVLVLAGELGVS